MDERYDTSYGAGRPIETASATTSPDNANSGPAAYIILGVTSGILIVLCLLISSCSTAFSHAVIDSMHDDWGYIADQHQNGGSQTYDFDLDEYDFNEREFEEELMRLLEQEGVGRSMNGRWL